MPKIIEFDQAQRELVPSNALAAVAREVEALMIFHESHASLGWTSSRVVVAKGCVHPGMFDGLEQQINNRLGYTDWDTRPFVIDPVIKGGRIDNGTFIDQVRFTIDFPR